MSLTVSVGYMAAHFYATWPFLVIGAVMSGFDGSVYCTASGHYLNTVSGLFRSKLENLEILSLFIHNPCT